MTETDNDSRVGDTAGYALCRHRRYGCEWTAVYRTFAEEPAALEARRIHELICHFTPLEVDREAL